jgi:iron-sulfur cluster repair protein YtfE (RIC family)
MAIKEVVIAVRGQWRHCHYASDAMTITQALHHHHKHCDELFAVAEELGHQADWVQCGDRFAHFQRELEAHFESEEQLLFPALEAATGSVGGPTQMMRYEHQQMRGLLGELAQTLATRQGTAFAGLADTLLVLMQQHNLKEEHILYPMCDRMLAGTPLAIEDDLQRRARRVCAA